MRPADYPFLLLSLVLAVSAATWIFLRLRRRARARAAETAARKEEARCSFCRRSRDEVVRLLHGPEAYICDACVRVCEEMLALGKEDDFSASRAEPELPVN